MDFNKLMQTMRDLDRPVGESAVEECGSPMMAGMTPPMSTTPPVTPPSMSVNLNAQGMDSIESLLKLMTKVNPDMINQPMPKAAEIEPMGMPSLTPPGPSITPLSLGNLDSGPLKMLPDFDKGNDDMPGGEKDDSPVADIQKAMGDQDGDGDHDMDDHDMEKKMVDKDPIDRDGKEDGEADNDKEKEGLGGALAGGAVGALAGGPLGALTGAAAGDSLTDADPEEKDEEYANEPDTEVKSVDYMNNQLAGGMNRPKGTHPKVAGGDNPMQKMEGLDLRSQIRAELQQRLAEAKGAK